MTRARIGALVGLVVGLLVLGPALARGYLLRYDLVFVPDEPITATVLGLDGGVPRAVPDDLVVAVVSRLIPADVLEKLLLLGSFVLAGVGAARLSPTRRAAAVASIVYCWNAWVAERLLIGHWAFLLAYAGLPFVVAAAVGLRQRRRHSLLVLVTTTLVVGLTGSTGWALALLVTLPVLLWPGPPRARGQEIAVWVLATLGSAAVWAVPSIARPGGILPDPAGFTAFAARGWTAGGAWLDLLSLGGIWNQSAVPGERRSLLLVGLTAALVLVVLVVGVRRLWRGWDGLGAALVCVGAGSLLVAGLPSFAAVAEALGAAATHLPALGLLRDSQKWSAPFVLVVALSAGIAADRASRAARSAGAVVLGAAALVPLLLLPGLAWGAGGRLVVSDYPSSWSSLRDAASALPDGTDIASVPPPYYRRYDWNHDITVLDPMPRWMPRVVVVVDDLPLSDGVVAGEDPRGRRLAAILEAGGSPASALAAMGISGMVVAEDQPTSGTISTEGMRLVARARGLALYAVTTTVVDPPRPPAWTAAGLLAWSVALTAVCVSWVLVGARALLASRATRAIPGQERP
ncbi:MAG: hypothetical protein U0R68_04635 [Candidatus Nanopelagicales bacterium]